MSYPNTPDPDDMTAGLVMIPEATYNLLKESDRKLQALEAAGVDNWEGYSVAMRDFYGDEDED
jgi:hypothetical protein